MTSPFKDVPLISNGRTVAWHRARFVRCNDGSGHWETLDEPTEVIRNLWVANGLVELRRVDNGAQQRPE